MQELHPVVTLTFGTGTKPVSHGVNPTGCPGAEPSESRNQVTHTSAQTSTRSRHSMTNPFLRFDHSLEQLTDCRKALHSGLLLCEEEGTQAEPVETAT